MSWIEDPGISSFGGFNISQLGLDQAWVNVTSFVRDASLWIYELSEDCHKCPFEKKSALNYTQPYGFIVSTKFPTKYRIRTSDLAQYVKSKNDSFKFCDMDTSFFGEFGVYNIHIGGTPRNPQCRVETALQPVNIYYPLLLAFLFYLILGLFLFVVTTGLKSFFKSSSSSGGSSSSKTSRSSITVAGAAGDKDKDPHVPTIPHHFHSHHPRGDDNHHHHPIYGTTTTPLTRVMGSTSNVHINPNPGGQGLVQGQGHYGHQDHYGILQHHHHHPGGVMSSSSSGGGGTTEVSISTISSTPTSTAVTTYRGGHVNGGGDVIDAYHLPPQQHQAVGLPGPGPAGPHGPGPGAIIGIRQPLTIISNNHQTVAYASASNASANNAANGNNASHQRQRQRLRSLDTFRGICIVLMIFVNDGGAGYYFFEHATWDGLYVADLVFPWFLWIMGVCIPVSIKSQVKRGNSKLKILQRILIRSLKLILLGILLGSIWGPVQIEGMRLPGVLQRFGICYLVCCTLVLFCMTVNITKPETSKIRAALQDVQIIWISWLLILLLVLIHCILTFFLEVPGCPTGYLGPGGLHDYFYEPYRTIAPHCIGGAAGYIDRQILQPAHIYQNPTAKTTYKSGPYDPEGILGTLTSIFQVWLGVQTGVTMLVYPRASSRLKRWTVWALISGALGALLFAGGWIPLNKNLWSLSFVLVTNCFALLLLSFLYFLVDIKKWWSGSPLFEPGMNSILLYVGHSVLHLILPFHFRVGEMRTHFSKLIESLWGTTLWVGFALYLNKRKIFWTV